MWIIFECLIKKLIKILEGEGLIVDQDYVSPTKKRKALGRVGYNPLYEHIQSLADGPLTSGSKRMLRVDEISRKKIV